MPVLGQHRRLSRRRGDLRRVFAAQTLGFPLTQLMGLDVVMQGSAILGAPAWSWPMDRLGPRLVVMIALARWAAVTVAAFSVQTPGQFCVVTVAAGAERLLHDL